MKRLTLSVIMLQIALMSASCWPVQPQQPDVIVQENNAVLTWTHTLLHDDDSVMELSEIAGYMIQYGLESDPGRTDFLTVDIVETATIPDLAPGKYQFWIWTVDIFGQTSELSAEATATVIHKVRPATPALSAEVN